ncbi:MAG: DUF1254 domain-containing protein [Opitutaceae bacterium]
MESAEEKLTPAEAKEPEVIIVPGIKDHNWNVQLHDNYSRWWHMIGSQFSAPGSLRRLLIGPNWSGKLPDGFVGADIVPSESDFAGMEKVRGPGKLTGVDYLRWVSLVLKDPSFTKQTGSLREVTAFARFERLGLKTGTPFDPD